MLPIAHAGGVHRLASHAFHSFADGDRCLPDSRGSLPAGVETADSVSVQCDRADGRRRLAMDSTGWVAPVRCRGVQLLSNGFGATKVC